VDRTSDNLFAAARFTFYEYCEILRGELLDQCGQRAHLHRMRHELAKRTGFLQRYVVGLCRAPHLQLCLAEMQAHPRGEEHPVHAPALQPDTVLAAAIAQQVPTGSRDHLRVLCRDRPVAEHQVTVWRGSDLLHAVRQLEARVAIWTASNTELGAG
jgi:hypothetical protein